MKNLSLPSSSINWHDFDWCRCKRQGANEMAMMQSTLSNDIWGVKSCDFSDKLNAVMKQFDVSI